jgi:hypothetical protein
MLRLMIVVIVVVAVVTPAVMIIALPPDGAGGDHRARRAVADRLRFPVPIVATVAIPASVAVAVGPVWVVVARPVMPHFGRRR